MPTPQEVAQAQSLIAAASLTVPEVGAFLREGSDQFQVSLAQIIKDIAGGEPDALVLHDKFVADPALPAQLRDRLTKLAPPTDAAPGDRLTIAAYLKTLRGPVMQNRTLWTIFILVEFNLLVGLFAFKALDAAQGIGVALVPLLIAMGYCLVDAFRLTHGITINNPLTGQPFGGAPPEPGKPAPAVPAGKAKG